MYSPAVVFAIPIIQPNASVVGSTNPIAKAANPIAATKAPTIVLATRTLSGDLSFDGKSNGRPEVSGDLYGFSSMSPILAQFQPSRTIAKS